MPIPQRLLAAALTGGLLAASLAGAAAAAAPTAPARTTAGPALAAAAPKPAKTSALEATRVDRVKAPKLDWYPCFDIAECATARVPLDYDNPKGSTTELALLRIKAKDQKNRIGSLFLNPGGPGGQGTAIAYAAPQFLSESVLDRFDIVGVDPRGIGFSDNIKCFTSLKDQAAVMKGLNVAFPYTTAEKSAFVASSKKLGKACSTGGKRLAGAMSTAEVARDMDVLRRSVGDKKLNYMGFSYGSALGQYYANMFPDRFRALVVDGVIDPTKWVGSAATKEVPSFDRIRSADGSYKALKEVLVRCDKAGGLKCVFAAGDPVKNFETIAQRLRAKPLVIEDPEFGTFTFTYADFIVSSLIELYYPDGAQYIVEMLSDLYTLTEPPAASSSAARTAARSDLVAKIRSAKTNRPAAGFPYDNSLEAFAGVSCTDSLNPADAGSFPGLADKADKRAPYFGRVWVWNTPWCASKTWTVRDEDAYKGPFTKRTVAPVLIVGNYWDPATNYSGAVAASKLLPNSRLLSSDSWGHTAYGTSTCATTAIDNYLLKATLPAKGKLCVGDLQPFATAPQAARTDRASTDIDVLRSQRKSAAASGKKLPPVVINKPVGAQPGR
ncbi:MAG TPA: alpha/beta hydrolase [Actinoplanes sp.]|jgi:pimeloyl-ACP methyl ester carboxylesterase